MPPKNSTTRVPTPYRIFFLYIEPFMCLVGAYYAYFLPKSYLTLTDAGSAPTWAVPRATSVALDQLANLYLLFAFHEAILLRATDDLRVWRTYLIGLLIADFGHLWSVRSLGTDVYWRLDTWNAIDWGNVAFVYFGAATRICFLLRVGFGGPRRHGKANETRR